MRPEDAIVLYGATALDFWRHERGANLTAGAAAQAPHPASAGASLAKRSVRTRAALELAGQTGLSLPLQVSVASPAQKRPSTQLCCHVWHALSQTPGPRQLAPGVFVPVPAVAVAQAAASLDFVDLLLVALEFAGCYVLSPGDDAGMVATSAPLLSLDELRRAALALANAGGRGSALLGRVARVAAAGSKSPMESKLFAFLSLDRRLGGFGIPGLLLNPSVSLSAKGGNIVGRPSIRPDLFEPRGRTALEHQSYLHPLDRREKDDRRADAFEATGIRCFQVNKARVRDLRDLSSIAYEFARRAGIRRARPSEQALQRRAELHRRLFLAPADVSVGTPLTGEGLAGSRAFDPLRRAAA